MYIFHGMNEISDNASRNHQKPWTWAGLRPIRTLWFDQPPVGGVQIGLFKTTRQRATLSLVLLDSLPALATRPRMRARLTWKPVRWTLALKPTIWRAQDRAKAVTSRNQQQTAPWFQHGSPVTSRNSDASQQSFPEQHVENVVFHVDEWQRSSLLNQQMQVSN